MNKKQRWVQIQRYEGAPRLVFERRLLSLEAKPNGVGRGAFQCRIEYSIHTNRISSFYAFGETPLQAARIAWQGAKHRFETSKDWYLKRGWQIYEYDDADVPQIHNIEHKDKLRETVKNYDNGATE